MFSCANPLPGVGPEIVVTGRSDFPNQVNNSFGFPGLIRGALDVRTKAITDEMALAAGYGLADFAESQGLSTENIVPRMDDW